MIFVYEYVTINQGKMMFCQDAVPKQLSDLIGVSPEQSVFFAPFKSIAPSVDSAEL